MRLASVDARGAAEVSSIGSDCMDVRAASPSGRLPYAAV